jgi:peptidoglycan/LPS O-acetylase OafA/YrhL
LAHGSQRIRTVDGLRGLAALLVVLDHAIDDSWGLGSWTEQNHGITIFALLTGFLLSSQFLRSRLDGRSLPPFVSFAKARVVRIFPAYWLVLGIATLTVGLHAMGPGDAWRVITLTQTFGTDTPYEGLIPMWSLSLFLSFYLFLPLWAWWRRRSDSEGEAPESILKREVKWLLALLGGALLVRVLSLTDPIAKDPEFSLFGRADWFAVGMLLSALVVARARGLAPRWLSLPGSYPGWAFAGAAILTVLSAMAPPGFGELQNQLDLGAAGLVVFGAVLHGSQLKGPQRVLASRPARALGRWSYGIFLWGYFSEKAIADIFPGIGTLPLIVLTLASGIALGAASWRWVEKPISQAFRAGWRPARLGRIRRSAGAETAPA